VATRPNPIWFSPIVELRTRGGQLARIAVAVVGPLLAIALMHVIPPLGQGSCYQMTLVAVAISATLAGRRAGLVSTAVGAIVSVLLLVPGYQASAFRVTDELVRFVSFLLLAVGTSVLCAKVRDRYLQAQEARAAQATLGEELARSRDQLRLVMDALPALVAYVDSNERYVVVNAAYEEWFRRPNADIVGSTVAEVLGPQVYALVQPHIRTALSGRPADYQYFNPDVRAGAGAEVHVRYVPHLVRGQTEGFFVFVQDVTDQERARHALEAAHAALREANERFELATSAIAGFVYEFDVVTGHTSRSAGLEEVLGFKPAEVRADLGWWTERIHPEDRPGVCEAYNRAISTRAPRFEVEYRVRHRDGHYVFVSDRAHLLWDDSRVIRNVGFTTDITTRKALEHRVALERARLEAAKTEAEEANRAKDEFLAMLGHELRNPLAPIVTALQLMRLQGATKAFDKERAVIERQVRHVVRLVDDLLEVSRITRGKIALELGPVDIADVLARAVETTGPALEQHRHRVAMAVTRDLIVEGDAARLCQVFANLLSNAAKYTSTGSVISVRAQREGNGVRVSVRDTGRGIRREMLPRIFDRFVQERQPLDRSEGGLGLGLAIVRALVELHRGTVEARSEGLGHGSEFIVRLPASHSQAHSEANASAPSVKTGASDGRRILIVDDNEDVGEMFAEALGKMGHTVDIAHDGPQALSKLAQAVPDIALLDIGLPVMDGYELARRIRTDARLRHVRLVAVTGYGQSRDRARSEEAGFDLHLVKPVDLETLTQVIQRGRVST
jgi:PAS domain S-box-containing protein